MGKIANKTGTRVVVTTTADINLLQKANELGIKKSTALDFGLTQLIAQSQPAQVDDTKNKESEKNGIGL